MIIAACLIIILLFIPMGILLKVEYSAGILHTRLFFLPLYRGFFKKIKIIFFHKQFSLPTFFKKNIPHPGKKNINLYNTLPAVLKIKKLRLKIFAGTGSAASTCLLIGAIQALLNPLILTAGTRFRQMPPAPYLYVDANFSKPELWLEAECIAVSRLGDIIWKLIKEFLDGLIKKTGERLKNERRQQRNKAVN